MLELQSRRWRVNNLHKQMNATTTRPATAVSGAAVQATANASCDRPQAPMPTSIIVRRSTCRTKKKLERTPSRPQQLTMAEYAKACSMPAMARK